MKFSKKEGDNENPMIYNDKREVEERDPFLSPN